MAVFVSGFHSHLSCNAKNWGEGGGDYKSKGQPHVKCRESQFVRGGKHPQDKPCVGNWPAWPNNMFNQFYMQLIIKIYAV